MASTTSWRDRLAPFASLIEPGQFARVQFDCPAGTVVRAADLPCVVGDLADTSGLPFDPQLHDRARCVIAFGAAAPTTTTIITTTSTTSAPTPTTTTSLPPGCGNAQIDAGEECDDGNQNPDDGCTNSCTICGNDS
jgi:cysteine-rich repeat protein